MKHSIFFVLGISVFILGFTSCMFVREEVSCTDCSLCVRFPPSHNRSGTESVNPIHYYKTVVLSRNNLIAESESPSNYTYTIFEGLSTGTYRIIVTAYSLSDEKINEGTTELKIKKEGMTFTRIIFDYPEDSSGSGSGNPNAGDNENKNPGITAPAENETDDDSSTEGNYGSSGDSDYGTPDSGSTGSADGSGTSSGDDSSAENGGSSGDSGSTGNSSSADTPSDSFQEKDESYTPEIHTGDINITSAADYIDALSRLKENTGLNIALMADIDLSQCSQSAQELTIGTFSGAFYGNGHTIIVKNDFLELDAGGENIDQGITLKTRTYMGLCQVNSGTIQDLTVAGIMYDRAGNPNCIFAGIALGNTGTIKNCTNRISFTAYGKSYKPLAGIVYHNQGTIESCTNSGIMMTGNTNTGTLYSLAGFIAGVNEGTVKNCRNSGSVTGAGGSATVACNVTNTGILSEGESAHAESDNVYDFINAGLIF